jgi:alpha-beta hydrolase superfamily lysophospholipase
MLIGLSASLAGCAPMVQHAFQRPSDFAGPSFSGDRFVSFDGARLGLKTWKAEARSADDPDADEPNANEPWAVIVGLHGMDDYSAAFHLAGPWWAKQGITTYAFDQRGFGRSPGRGVWAGQDLMTGDLKAACAVARRMHPKAIVAVAGESMGGAVAVAAFASQEPPDADRLILLSPAVWGFSQQPLPYSAMLWMASHTMPQYVVKPPSFLARHIWASDNVRELIRMGRDPLMIFGSRFDTLYGLVSLMETAWQGVDQMQPVPALYMYGAHDQIIPPPAAISAAARLRPPGRTLYYRRGWHLLLRDLQAETVWADAEAFIRDPAGPAPSGAPPIPKSVPRGPKKPDLPPGVSPDGKIHLSELPRGES